MAKISRDLSTGILHPRETLFASGALGALNAELVSDCDGCASVMLDLRGTFSLTVTVEATLDGTNWVPIPVRPLNTANVAYVAAVTGSVTGMWSGSIFGFRRVRARCSAYTSGTAIAVIGASNAPVDQSLQGLVTSGVGTNVGAAGAAVTLTMASPGAGLRHYLTYLSINRYAAAALTASATPVTVTTTNLPGTPAFTFAADALTLGQIDRWREDFAYPIASAAQATATTIVCPATTGIIWRVTAGFYAAP